MEYLLILGAIFIIWQLSFVHRIQNLKLPEIITTDDTHIYQKNMWASLIAFTFIVILNHYMHQNMLYVHSGLLLVALIIQLGYSFLIVQYKNILFYLELIESFRNNGKTSDGRRILTRVYSRMYKLVKFVLSFHLKNNAYVDRKQNNKLVYEKTATIYLVLKFEELIKDYNLEKELNLKQERLRLEQQIIQNFR